MAIVEGIAAAKAAFEVSKVALDLTRYPKLDNDAIRAKLLELQGLILSAQAALGEARDENTVLRAELDLRNVRQEFAKQFVAAEGVYWVSNYPYCPNCWEIDQKPMRLSGPFYSGNNVNGKWTCPGHNSTFFLRLR
jgi:hypothetical protein